MIILLTIIHVVVCIFLVIVVLLQSGKAADLAGAFGGMGSQTAFGPRGAATVLSKATTIAAGLFMVTSLTLAIMATRNAGTGSSVLERQKRAVQKNAAPATNPAAPAAATPAPGAQPAAPGAPATAPGGQPSVTLDYGGGKTQTVPLDVNKLPKVDPSKQAPPAAPAKK
jgi:preprotein translocase subunit SecG